MNDTTLALFGVAALLAAGDWIAVATGRKPLEYLCKPATMVALIAAALTLDASDDPRRIAFVVALLLSAAGDVFLMLPRDRFVAGLAAFFAAHIAYIVGFRLDDPASGLDLLVPAAAVLVVIAVVGTRIMRAVRDRSPALAGPVAGYIAVISVMVASAVATREPLAAAGAVVFMASDTLIAWNRFVQKLPWAPVAIMVTYHLGQAGLVASLTR